MTTIVLTRFPHSVTNTVPPPQTTARRRGTWVLSRDPQGIFAPVCAITLRKGLIFPALPRAPMQCPRRHGTIVHKQCRTKQGIPPRAPRIPWPLFDALPDTVQAYLHVRNKAAKS